jgi:hypothetical protein
MIGLLLSIAAISGAVAPQIQLIGLAVYLLTAFLALGGLSAITTRAQIAQQQRRSTRQATAPTSSRGRKEVTISNAAERAQARASYMPGYLDDFRLVDVGLIASEIGADGLKLRRAEFSLDDQGLQPYVVLHADPAWADQRIPVRFEILDHAGEVRFLREDPVFLREGRNNILCAYRMPLDSKSEGRAGLWELRIAVADNIVALHTFEVGPSLRERQRMIQEESASIRRRQRRLADTLPEEDADSPISLEELLRGQQ